MKRITHAERKERRKRIAAMAAAGATWQAIAAEYGVGYATIVNACYENGVPRPATGGTNHSHIAVSSFAILKALLDGNTVRGTFLRFGVSKQRVHQIKSKAIEAGFQFPQGE